MSFIHPRINVLGISKHGRVLSITRGLFAVENEKREVNNANIINKPDENLNFNKDRSGNNDSIHKLISNNIQNIKTQDNSIYEDKDEDEDDIAIASTKIKKVIHETSSIDMSLNNNQNISLEKIPDTSETSGNKNVLSSLNEIDKDTNRVKEYMHTLLRYINYNDATLNSDKDGDLHFFINHMPDAEKKMNFGEWIQYKLIEINKEFVKNLTKKSLISKEAFTHLLSRIESIDENEDKDDPFLINICDNLK